MTQGLLCFSEEYSNIYIYISTTTSIIQKYGPPSPKNYYIERNFDFPLAAISKVLVEFDPGTVIQILVLHWQNVYILCQLIIT